MKLKRFWVVTASMAMVAMACTASPSSDGDGVAGAATAPATDLDATTTTESCSKVPNQLRLTEMPTATPEGLVELSERVFNCVDTVVVYQASSQAKARFAAQTAVDAGGPLLMVQDAGDLGPVVSEIGRVRAQTVQTIGLSESVSARLNDTLRSNLGLTTTEVVPPTTVPASTAAPATVAPTTEAPTPTAGAADTPSTTVPDADTVGNNEVPATAEVATTEVNEVAPVEQTDVTSPESIEEPSTTADGIDTTIAVPSSTPSTTIAPFVSISGPGSPTSDGPVVLFDPAETLNAYLTTPSITAGGGDVNAMSLDDVDALRAFLNGRANVVLPADATPTAQWQVALAKSGNELFGGGTRVFPDRRIVAYYGNPLTFRLGLLGETDPERAVERVTERAALYEAEGLPPVQPGFEIIATVAATQAGDDGNYSNEMDVEVLRPWIETALANDVSVILDLQPGRTDFVTQAKIYEEFLRLPNVGLALDPEWRLAPDQRHLRQIGKVSAEEVNAVTDYLTSLVREENLPQKILILHQFQIRMLPDRELIKTVPEIATVIHVDGQGSLGSKYGTWGAMLEAPTDPDQELWWAWKNFIDEDIPTARPAQVNAVEPLPVIVTYQ
ncbi:MAG: hypothetical protein HKN03_13925 [Acidimicrobiales bacterium]|nr:hypothetical protein [Acidimicrobiales bacterium]